MPAVLDLSGLDRTIAKLTKLNDLNAAPLMKTWGDIMIEGNRRGVLAGLDKDGVPMKPVTYRPKAPGPLKQTKRPRIGKFQGLQAENYGNLPSGLYRLLGGPPLAPRAQMSRVITNFRVTFGGPITGARTWFVLGGWYEVVSLKRVPFLRYHFRPEEYNSPLPRRDLAGVRPVDIQKAREALQNWAKLELRKIFGS
jgi:hypothetical protein